MGASRVRRVAVVGADSGRSLPPELRTRNLLWTAGDREYLVAAASTEDEGELVRALVAAAASQE